MPGHIYECKLNFGSYKGAECIFQPIMFLLCIRTVINLQSNQPREKKGYLLKKLHNKQRHEVFFIPKRVFYHNPHGHMAPLGIAEC